MNEELISKVASFAKRAHRGQIRKLGKDKDLPYFDTHVCRVADRVRKACGTEDQIIAAYLHDVKEDCEDSWDEIELIDMGVSTDAIDIVDALTRIEGENYKDFILRICKNPDAIKIKIADINDNLSDLPEGSLKDKYRCALYILGLYY